MGSISLIFIVIMFPINRWEYETQGITKFLNKEIMIKETTITYDSQDEPIDTTYSYAKCRNKNTD